MVKFHSSFRACPALRLSSYLSLFILQCCVRRQKLQRVFQKTSLAWTELDTHLIAGNILPETYPYGAFEVLIALRRGYSFRSIASNLLANDYLDFVSGVFCIDVSFRNVPKSRKFGLVKIIETLRGMERLTTKEGVPHDIP